MNKLITLNNGTRYILYFDGPTLGIKVIEKNTFQPGTDEYNNKEIEDYEVLKQFFPSEQNSEHEIKNHESDNI